MTAGPPATHGGPRRACQDADVTAPALVRATAHTVRLDHGQFHLVTAWEEGGDDLVALISEAVAHERIAHGRHVLVVISPHQNNFEMALDVELWDAQPPDDVGEWEEVFLATLAVREAGVLYSNTDLDVVDLHVPPGRYGLRIAGRGFVNVGWPGSTTPGDEWRIQFWPAATHEIPRRVKSWSGYVDQ